MTSNISLCYKNIIYLQLIARVWPYLHVTFLHILKPNNNLQPRFKNGLLERQRLQTPLGYFWKGYWASYCYQSLGKTCIKHAFYFLVTKKIQRIQIQTPGALVASGCLESKKARKKVEGWFISMTCLQAAETGVRGWLEAWRRRLAWLPIGVPPVQLTVGHSAARCR